jgi:Holliday junction resolvasome RuvABC endonuclease subunit
MRVRAMTLASLSEVGQFVAIDSSTTSIAFAYVDNNNIANYGKMKFEGQGIYEKISDIARKTEGLFKALPVDTIVIEASFYSNNPKTATNLALAQGAILGAASTMGAKHIYSVPPVVWQRGIGNLPFSKDDKAALAKEFPGKSPSWYQSKVRQLRKQKTINLVNANYSLDVDDDDVADALGIAMYTDNNRGRIK